MSTSHASTLNKTCFKHVFKTIKLKIKMKLLIAITLFAVLSLNAESLPTPQLVDRAGISVPGIGTIDIGNIASELSLLVVSGIVGFGDGKKIDFMNERCTVYIKSRLVISGFLPKTVYDSQFECGGHLSGVQGSARGKKNSKTAVEGAITDFITKAYNANLLTAQDLVNVGH